TYPHSRYPAKALQGALTPPKSRALAAHKFGSGSLCGGATSNCVYPHAKFFGRNSRPESADGAACPQAAHVRVNRESHRNRFIKDLQFSNCFASQLRAAGIEY